MLTAARNLMTAMGFVRAAPSSTERAPPARRRNHIEYFDTLEEPAYHGGNLATWFQSVDFVSDARFRRAHDRALRDTGAPMLATGGMEWSIMMSLWFAKHASRLSGAFVECGVAMGVRSLAICDYLDFNSLEKDFYLFDTYCGIPESQMSPAERADRTAENATLYAEDFYEGTKARFSSYRRVKVIRGEVPTILDSVDTGSVAFLHLDMNIALPEVKALQRFWPKLSIGAPVLLDDYGWRAYRPQKEALDSFASEIGVEIIMLPTGQGLLLKS